MRQGFIGISLAIIFGAIAFVGSAGLIVDKIQQAELDNFALKVQLAQVNTEIDLGAINFVAAASTKLGGSGVAATDTTINLVRLETPAGNSITMTDFGDTGYGTLEPRRTNKEFISFTGITQNSDGTARLTGVVRGLRFVSPYNASTTLRKAHPGGSSFVISNPPQLLNTQVSKFNDSFVSGTITFSSTTEPRYVSDPLLSGSGDDLLFAHKGYVDTVATSGVRAASFTQSGRVQIATEDGVSQGSSTVADGADTVILVPPTRMFDATSTATTSVPVSRGDGKISQGYLDLTENFEFTGNFNVNGTNFTVSSTNINIGTSTFTGKVTLDGSTPTGNEAASITDVANQISASSTILIGSSTLSSATNTISVTITRAYPNMTISVYGAGPTGSGAKVLRINGSTAADYAVRRSANGTFSLSASATSISLNPDANVTSTAFTFQVFNGNTTLDKLILWSGVSGSGSSFAPDFFSGGATWATTTVVASFQYFTNAGDFAAGSWMKVEGF